MAAAPTSVSPVENVDRLVASLIDAVQIGNVALSKDLAAQATNSHLHLDIQISKNENSLQSQEKEFSVNVQVENKETRGTRFELFVKSTDSISCLKRKVSKLHNIPPDVQRWIIGKKIPDNSMTLEKCGVTSTGHTLFLYIVITRHEMDLRSDLDRNDFSENSMMLSPTMMSNALSYIERGKDSELLMDSNTYFNTMPYQIKKPTSPKRLEFQMSPPPIPDRAPFQDTFVETDSIKDRVAWNPLLQVIPTPIQTKTESKPSGWECPMCTYFNLPTRPGCEMCSSPRPNDYVVPDDYQMTNQEMALIAQQDELERLTRHDHETTLHDNFMQWLKLDDLDLVQNTESFDCPICMMEYEPGEGVVLRDCLHQFCKDCLKGAVMHSEEPILKCPYQDDDCTCESVLQEREIRALVPEDLFIKYLQRGLDQAESQAANSFHCKTTDCKGWCLYEDEVNFFVCPICKKENCLTCKVIHEGMNCKEYQADLATQAVNDNAARKTHLLIQKMVNDGTAMNCPQCKIIVQKKDGCDWIKCSVCKTEICWVTKGPRWGSKGCGDISGGCRCGIEEKRCHPKCANCH